MAEREARPTARKGHVWHGIQIGHGGSHWWRCLRCHARFRVKFPPSYFRERWGKIVQQEAEPPCRAARRVGE